MNKAVGLLLALVGAVLVYQGFARKDSLAGGAAELGAKVANKVDGGARVPQYAYSIGGGAVLVVLGGALALRKSA